MSSQFIFFMIKAFLFFFLRRFFVILEDPFNILVSDTSFLACVSAFYPVYFLSHESSLYSDDLFPALALHYGASSPPWDPPNTRVLPKSIPPSLLWLYSK